MLTDREALRIRIREKEGTAALGLRLLSGEPSSRTCKGQRQDLRPGHFEIARRYFLAKCTEADFEQYRRNRAFHAWKEAMLEAGPQATETSCGWPGHLLLRRVRVGMAYDSAARSECEAANGGGHASSACRSGCQCAPRLCRRGHRRNRSARSPVERWDHGGEHGL